MNLATLDLLFVLYLQNVRGDSPLGAGLARLPLFLPLALLTPLTGRLTARVGPKLPMSANLALGAAGLAVLSQVGAGLRLPAAARRDARLGIGMAILTPAVVAAAIAAVPAERAGLASAVNNTARQAGGAIGIAAFGALAGSPSPQGSFLSGFHAAALVGAGLWVAMAAISAALIPGLSRGRSPRSRAQHLRLLEDV